MYLVKRYIVTMVYVLFPLNFQFIHFFIYVCMDTRIPVLSNRLSSIAVLFYFDVINFPDSDNESPLKITPVYSNISISFFENVTTLWLNLNFIGLQF